MALDRERLMERSRLTFARAVAASAALLVSTAAAADASTDASTKGKHWALSVREANRCWPRRHLKALALRDRARVDDALAREADRLGSSSGVAQALLQFERWYVQERNGQIHVYAEPAYVYEHSEDADTRRCPNFFGNDVADDAAFWRATYDLRSGTFVELDLANFDAHL
ncbi:MAG: hypothetical protein JWN44_2985 [Myxococcales bacterium]|nr:hypothetical protein [Myxococcales bacterium]